MHTFMFHLLQETCSFASGFERSEGCPCWSYRLKLTCYYSRCPLPIRWNAWALTASRRDGWWILSACASARIIDYARGKMEPGSFRAPWECCCKGAYGNSPRTVHEKFHLPRCCRCSIGRHQAPQNGKQETLRHLQHFTFDGLAISPHSKITDQRSCRKLQSVNSSQRNLGDGCSDSTGLVVERSEIATGSHVSCAKALSYCVCTQQFACDLCSCCASPCLSLVSTNKQV